MREDPIVLGTPRRRARPGSVGARTLAKVLIAGVTLVGLISQGAQFIAAPLLIPALWWAARSSKAWGAAGFTLLAGLLMAEVGWLVAYTTTREARPWILLWPLAGLVTTIAIFSLTRHALSSGGEPR